MRFLIPLILALCSPCLLLAQDITNYEDNKSLPYEVVINTYKKLAGQHKEARLLTYGPTDSGNPLHLFVISGNGEFDPQKARENGKIVLLVNNGIHPGEPCGIDASLEWSHDLLNKKTGNRKWLDNVVVCIIPVYNIGGSLNRSCCSRANQNGPEAYGFRGNSANLDLNRDFIKNDSRNSQAFADIFHSWDPEVFIDAHTSNGADYQYIMTLLTTQKDKLHAPVNTYLTNRMLPTLYEDMKSKKFEMIPYVYSMGATPEAGIQGFPDSPRYSSGYAALFQTIGFTTETHMFKLFRQRVQSTYEFLNSTVSTMSRDREQISDARNKAREAVKTQPEFTITWELDTNTFEQIPFNGYEARKKTSSVTGKERMYYDRSAPYTRNIRYYNNFKPRKVVKKPKAYIIPQVWTRVIDGLKRNQVKLNRLQADQTLEVEVYVMESWSKPDNPYEGHYFHKDKEARVETQRIQFHRGDYVVYANQIQNEFIVSVLEPEATDSYFTWNYFDSALQQKEWFSSYVFEDEAERMLSEDPALKKEFEAAKKADPKMAENSWAQLYWLYKRSKYYEPSHNRYPVARLVNDTKLSVEP